MSQTNQDWWQRATRVIPGGVNSPVRSFDAVGGSPIFVASGRGTQITLVDGRELTDYCGSWGPLILGHAQANVVQAVQESAAQGMTFGINTPREVLLAETLCEQIPYVEQVRLVNSGTEAVMTAIRLARGVTGRTHILKFAGCYHGHADYLLVSAGSGLLTGGVATSDGVSESALKEVLVAPYNDAQAVREIVAEYGDRLAAIIVEPIAGNMGLVPPNEGFLQELRDLTKQCQAMLIFDEVITGFRLGATTYGCRCDIEPDLTTLGKIIGGGMPIGGIAGREKVMKNLAPQGNVYQAGTLSGNPVAAAAGLATIKQLIADDPYSQLALLAERLATGVNGLAKQHGIAAHCQQLGGMFTLFFSPEPVRDLAGAKQCDLSMHSRFFRGMLDQGIYLPPSQFEVAFISAAHTNAEIDHFLTATDNVFAQLAKNEPATP